ncbi:ParM/StbA family protein [Terrisporobacter sp.]|uniref:ParM/StbA family protein n=1 Tax=Terrisporobacter sp. TaxID=1965305 RepID=UPI0028966A12|nr:ParM/StbA family protein [Terrisporobacter sp.]
MSQIISLEVGNITTTVMINNEAYTFETRIVGAEEHHMLDEKNDIFSVGGKKYVAELGNFENNLYKYEKKNFSNIVAYALGKVAKSGNVKVITSIPANQFNSFKDEMKNTIMANNQIAINVNGEDKNITIEECGVLPEGYSIYKTTPKNLITEGAKTVIVDIGGGTTELIFIDENGKFINGDSISVGLLELYGMIQTDIQVKTKKLLSIEDVRKFVDDELKIIGISKEYSYNSIVNKFAGSLLNLIKGKAQGIDQCNIIVAGGGAKILQSEIKEEFNQALFNTDVQSLCKSNMKVAEAKWKK